MANVENEKLVFPVAEFGFCSSRICKVRNVTQLVGSASIQHEFAEIEGSLYLKMFV